MDKFMLIFIESILIMDYCPNKYVIIKVKYRYNLRKKRTLIFK